MNMSKKNLVEICKEQTNYTIATSRATLDLFCEIMGYPKSKVNYFIADDPHGIVDIMEGYRIFNMTDIHVVISEYEHWLKLYGSNEELCKAVDAWYYYCQEWHEKHSYEEPQWVSVKDILPEEGKRLFVKVEFNDGVMYSAAYSINGALCAIEGYGMHDISYWKPIITPEQEAERSKGCPNLRSWLAGCPVEGMREATPEWKEEQRKAQEAAHQRVEECKQALYQAMEEEVKLNKF